MIELKDFVSETIKQIIEGVIEAQKHAVEKKAIVNPARKYLNEPAKFNLAPYYKDSSMEGYLQYASMIDFDVAVTTSTSDKATGGIAIFVAALSAGVKGEVSESNSSISKIKFSVPVSLPEQG